MRIHQTHMQRAILSAVQIAGLLAWIMVAPNTLRLLETHTRWTAKSTKTATRRLIEKGLLKETPQGLMLTPAGERYLNQIPTRPTHWDQKWRIVVFDIPERRRKSRDLLRHKLQHIGFVRLQNSVWVYPFECQELLELLKRDYKLGKEVVYAEAVSIERDLELRKQFGLRRN